jgi:hypothetical protein
MLLAVLAAWPNQPNLPAPNSGDPKGEHRHPDGARPAEAQRRGQADDHRRRDRHRARSVPGQALVKAFDLRAACWQARRSTLDASPRGRGSTVPMPQTPAPELPVTGDHPHDSRRPPSRTLTARTLLSDTRCPSRGANNWPPSPDDPLYAEEPRGRRISGLASKSRTQIEATEISRRTAPQEPEQRRLWLRQPVAEGVQATEIPRHCQAYLAEINYYVISRS